MVLRQRLMEQMESRMQVEDEELRDLIDMAILEAAEGAYLPLKERLCLRKELFDSFRRLDILQELGYNDNEISALSFIWKRKMVY